MASKQNDNNCINCEFRHEVSTFTRCVECLKNSKNGNQFPGWKEVEEPDH